MNIFVLDQDVRANARAHCDKHVVKMILESAQMLCTIANELGVSSPYKSTHKHHPSTIWAGTNRSNYVWLVQLMLALNEEYKHRYGHADDHLSVQKYLRGVDVGDVLDRLPQGHMTAYAQAMPDEYKDDDAVTAYRNYYRHAKKDLLQYTNRQKPEWLQ